MSRESRVARTALAAVVLGVVLVAMAYGSAWTPGGAPVWGIWAMIAGSALVMAGATCLGAANSHLRRRTVILIGAFLVAVIIAGFGLPLLLPPDAVDAPLVLGLPLRVAIEVYGVGILPLMVLPVIFALEFNAAGLDEASLDALRRECAVVRDS